MVKRYCVLWINMGLKQGKIVDTKGFYVPFTHVPYSQRLIRSKKGQTDNKLEKDEAPTVSHGYKFYLEGRENEIFYLGNSAINK